MKSDIFGMPAIFHQVFRSFVLVLYLSQNLWGRVVLTEVKAEAALAVMNL
jgi:hypothetical protein